MKRLYGNIGSTKATLQQRPEGLYALHVNLPVNVLLKIVYELTLILAFQSVITSELVSHNRGAALNKIAHGAMLGRILAISDDSGLNLSVTLPLCKVYRVALARLHSHAYP